MKKTIGILTIQSNNYGNRLQNYAVQFILEHMNFKVYSIRSFDDKYRNVLYIAIKRIWFFIKSRLFYTINSNFYKFNGNIKYNRDFLKETEYSISDYSAIIVGSDQVWNITFSWIGNNMFLPFYRGRKVSFSASFGVDSIPYSKEIVDSLNDFKALSVREEAGAKIIKELTGRDATVLVDPTMLLTIDEWRRVSKKPKGAIDGYILTYFLSPKCDDAKCQLEKIRNGKNVYELLSPEDKVAGKAGPSEFIWLFDHADIILTDSFHACVFSFLFDKPFIVYDRNWDGGNMNSRLKTLLKKFHLERKYDNSGLQNDIWEHNYDEGYKQLEMERKKAKDFLKKALEE